MRATGRLLLFIGAMFSIGLVAINLYIAFYSLANPGKTPPLIASYTTTPTNTQNILSNNDTPTNILIVAISSLISLALIAIIIKIYNHHMRSIIARLARLLHIQIFSTEILSTMLAWTISTLLLAVLAPAASILSIFAFIINELLFIFAWGAYGQPNYKI